MVVDSLNRFLNILIIWVFTKYKNIPLMPSISKIQGQYDEYKKAPAITRKRIYLETMEEVLPSMQKFVMGNNKQGVLPILPLRPGALADVTGK